MIIEILILFNMLYLLYRSSDNYDYLHYLYLDDDSVVDFEFEEIEWEYK